MSNTVVLEGIPSLTSKVAAHKRNTNDRRVENVKRDKEMLTITTENNDDVNGNDLLTITTENDSDSVEFSEESHDDSTDNRFSEDDDDGNDTFYSFTEFVDENKGASKPEIPALVEVSSKEEAEQSAKESVQRRKKRKAQRGAKQSSTNAVEDAKESAMFEVSNTLPGVVSMAFYCIANLSFHELLHTITWEITHIVGSEDLVYAAWIFIGILLVRSSGQLWYFLPGHQSRTVRKECQRRLRLRYTDAKIYQWLQENIVIKGIVDILGFYLIYMAVSHFWQKFVYCFDQRQSIFDSLPSVQHYYEKHGNYQEAHVYTETSNETGCNNHEICKYDENNYDREPNLEEQDELFLYENLSKVSYYGYYGIKEAMLLDVPTALILYTSSTMVSLCILYQFCSYQFLENW